MCMSSMKLIKCVTCGEHFNPAFNDETQPIQTHCCKINGEVDYGVEQVFEVVDYPIKPCPFCGGTAGVHSNGGVVDFSVSCNYCSASVKRWGSSQSYKDVIDEWNTRI